MTLLDQIMRIRRLDSLIRSKATGTPAELARKLRMSQSQTFNLLKLAREKLDAPIYYSRIDQCYCYNKDVRFFFGFRPEE